ncbi:high affinity copper uptake protein 1 isoform X3 [Lepidochelys kempii]
MSSHHTNHVMNSSMESTSEHYHLTSEHHHPTTSPGHNHGEGMMMMDGCLCVPRSLLLRDKPKEETNRTPLAIAYSPQLKPLQRIISDPQPILDNDPSLSQAFGGRPVLAHRQPANLKHILTSNDTSHHSNSNSGTNPRNKPRCQLCPHIYTSNTITGPNQISHTITGSFTCMSTKVIYAIMCQQCPSAMYIGQTGQSLCKRINGHKSDIRNGNIQRPVGEHVNLPGHTITDLKAAILQQRNFRTRLQRETAELQFLCKFDASSSGLNKDSDWLANYKSSFSSLGVHTSIARRQPHPP